MVNQDLILGIQGIEHLRLCLDVTAYWTGSVFNRSGGVLSFYNRALALVGEQLTHYITYDKTEFRPISERAFGVLPDWLSSPGQRQDYYSLTLERQPKANLPSDVSISFWAVEYQRTPVGAIRIMLPTRFIESSPDALIAAAIDLLAELDFDSGHSGYSLNWHYLSRRHATSSKRIMGGLAMRFPGLDLPHMVCALMAIPHGIKRVNWLTFLGPRLAEQAGNVEGLERRFVNSEARVHQLSRGIMIRAGSAPAIGDVNRQETLAPYHAVGSALAGIRSHRHPPFLLHPTRAADTDLTESWLAYFDD